MYRIREVDGHDDEIADTLVDLHRLTFFDSAPFRRSIGNIGGSLFKSGCRSASPELCRRRACKIPDTFVASAF